MTIVLYPIGYGRRLGTIEEVMAYMEPSWIEPEYAERIGAWFVSRRGQIGPGGAMRITQPDKTGFAPDGMSFHQRQRFNDGVVKYMACDLVCRNGGDVHRAPRWEEVPRQGSGHPDIGAFGVHCNVTGEPWHMQCIEVDGYQTWVNLGRRRPNPNFMISGGDPIPPPPPPPPNTPSYPVPPGSFTVPTLTSLRQFAPNNPAHVSVLQSQLNRWRPWQTPAYPADLAEDGNFGAATEAAVVAFQTYFKTYKDGNITVDAVVGEYTWNALFSDC